jgi:sugar/nucleoside kinase (ribokinase family)
MKTLYNKNMDFLAIGDVVIDAFIKLHDARVHCNLNDEDCEICMRWGDKIPYESATVVPAVGNSANAAVAAARLGLSSGLRAYVGADQYGQDCLAALMREKVDTTFVEVQLGKETNYHYVLWYENNRTILVKHERYDYALPALAAAPRWLYLSSLGDNSLSYQHAWVEQLKRWPDAKLAFQPGTFQMQAGVEALADIYKRSDVFFCNKEEAERILGKPPGSEIKDLLAGVAALGPKIVVITDDVRGSYYRDEQGATAHCPRYPDPRPPFEITGAGDALASTAVCALALGKNIGEALKWGSANASTVIQEIGAQKGLLTRAQLEEALAHPPAPWEVTPI